MEGVNRPPAAADGGFYLPDFCAPRMVLVVVLIAVLVAFVVTVARVGLGSSFVEDLARTALFLVWIALGSAAALCYLRPALARLGVVRGSAATLALLLLVTALVSEAAWWGAARGLYTGFETGPMLARSHLAFVAGNLAIALIVGGVGLRYWYVTHQWRRNVERDARSRVDALQARIRPHFLYNSMNTIAALTRSDPVRAEAAIEDLADLFRASLAETRNEVPFAEELEVARTYQRIEQLRLGARLAVEWRTDGVPSDARVPSLVLQPLLENAIYHGIERLPGGGKVIVEARAADGRIEIAVTNPRPPEGTGAVPARTGNRVALANIRERLELAFPGDAAVELGEAGTDYVARVRFPLRAQARGSA